MTTINVHQAKDYYQYIHFNIPLDRTVHHTPSGYMDIYRWLKSTTQLSNVCGAHTVNNQILFFDGHESHFDDHALRQTKCRNIQPFVLKEDDEINEYLNENDPNAKLKYL